jgi:Ca2+-binding RTX toxin-like protein
MPGYERFSLANDYFGTLTEFERQMFRDGLDMWAEVSGITFIEASPGHGDIEVAVFDLDPSTAGQGAYPDQPYYLDSTGAPSLYGVSETMHNGDIALDLQHGINMHVIVHEIGHALGLKHPHDSDGDTLSSELDNTTNTVMSYEGERFGVLGPLDIAAIQELYGPAWSDGQHVTGWSWERSTNTLTQAGSAADDVITGTAANDVIYGSGGADLIVTRAGNDTIHVSGMRFQVSAGEGLDSLYVSFASSSILDVYLNEDHRYLRSATSSGYEDMKLFSVERLCYTDGTLAFDTDGNAGQAYRLYQAAFERTPDNEGLKYWIGHMDEGNTTLVDIADSFLHSPEFVRTYGTEQTVSSNTFLELLYTHTLGRDYDQDGYNYWVDKLNAGETNRDRAPQRGVTEARPPRISGLAGLVSVQELPAS